MCSSHQSRQLVKIRQIRLVNAMIFRHRMLIPINMNATQDLDQPFRATCQLICTPTGCWQTPKWLVQVGTLFRRGVERAVRLYVSSRRGVYVRQVVFSLILPLESDDLHKQPAPVVVLKWILISPVEAPSEMNNTYYTAQCTRDDSTSLPWRREASSGRGILHSPEYPIYGSSDGSSYGHRGRLE